MTKRDSMSKRGGHVTKCKGPGFHLHLHKKKSCHLQKCELCQRQKDTYCRIPYLRYLYYLTLRSKEYKHSGALVHKLNFAPQFWKRWPCLCVGVMFVVVFITQCRVCKQKQNAANASVCEPNCLLT